MPAQKKLITVFGATGAQGGGLVNAILNDGQSAFAVKAVTRNAKSDKALDLVNRGAEVVEANVDDFESIKQALAGSYGAYFVTFFWDHFSPERELEEAQRMARAAKETGIEHAIWSTLEDTRAYIPLTDNRMPTLMEKYKVPHFDAKGEANHFFTDEGVPTTFLLTSFYWDNLIHFGMGPKRGTDGKLSISFPMGDKRLAGIASEDIGNCAYGIFKKGAELIGKTVGIAGGHDTVSEMAESLSTALDEPVTYNSIPFDTYRSFGFPGADDLGNMFQFYHDFEEGFNSRRSLAFAKELNPAIKTFDVWVNENLDSIKNTIG